MASDKIILITWRDAAGPETLEQYSKKEAEELLDPLTQQDVGWIVHENDERIVIGSERTEYGEFRRVMVIPCVNIVKREVLGAIRNQRKHSRKER